MRTRLTLLATLLFFTTNLYAGAGFDPLLGRIVTVPPASRLSYSTSTSGLSEANVQGAIDELATMIADVTTGGLSDIDQLPGDTTDDDKIDLGLLTTTPSFESMTLTGTSGLTLGVAGTTQGALVIASNTHAVYKNTIVPGTMTESVSWRLPGAMPAGADYLVNCDVTTGQMGYTNPATFQAADADLTTWAGVTPSANGQSLVSAANYAAMRGLLDLEAGTDFNAYDYDLGTLASGITGIVKGGGNGGGFSAATAGTDYLAPTGSASQLTGYSTGAQPLDSDLTALAGISGQRGDVIYYGAAGWTRLAKGTENYVLTQGANDPAWAAATGGGASAIDDLSDVTITTGEKGDVLYFDGSAWVNVAHGTDGQFLKTGGHGAAVSWGTPEGGGDMLASAYPAIAAIEGLNFADASIIQLTGADASAVLTSGGNNYILGSNSDNSALEFKTPANVLSQIGAQAASAVLTTYAGINPTANVQTMLGSANNAAILSNIGAQTADSDLTTLSAPTAWRVFYSNGSQAVTELALGADGTFLESNGASAAPAFRTLALSDLPTITPSKGGTGVANNDASTLTISGNYATTLTVTGATGVTLPTSGTLAALSGANTWTGNNTFGNGDGDTLTSRGIIVGGDRTGSNDAVQIAATLATPSYATGTNELYVAGDIETAGNVYATQFIGAATGDSYVQLANNTTLAPSGNRIYFEGNVLEVSENGTERTILKDSSSATLTGTTWDFSGVTNFEVPNAASVTTDAFGEIGADNDAWASGRGALQFFDGTANTLIVGALASDTPTNGQVPQWNTGGTITWETPAAAVSDGDKGDITVASSGASWSIDAFAHTASPNWIFYDSDNAGADEECARIEANATTTTDGAEDGDLIFSVMQGGTVTPFARLDESDDALVIYDSKRIIFDEAADDPNDADVVLSGADGVLTLAALNGANNENLTIDLDDTANTAKLSSSTGVTAIDFSALNLVTTGQICGAIDVNLISTATTLGAADCLGSYNEVTAATTVTLPSVADVPVGASVCVYVRDASEQVSVYPHHDDRFVLDGTAMADGEAVLSPSGATSAGAFITFIHDDANGWRSLGMIRTWTQATP